MPYLELEGADPEELVPDLLEEGSLEWVLARYRKELFPRWLAAGGPGTHNDKEGRKAWPPETLMAMCLLRWKGEGLSRRALIRHTDDRMSWRAAAGIPLEEDPPSDKTIRRFEHFLMEEHPEVGSRRILLWHEHLVRLCRQQGVGDDSEAVWVQDSTPMWCYGAVKDTVNLLGDGLRRMGKWWAKVTEQTLQGVAECWDLELLEASSTKGFFEIDWRDEAQRTEVVDTLAREVLERIDWIRRRIDKIPREYRQMKRKFLKLCRHLSQVVAQNLEKDQHGRMTVAQKVAEDRVISLTDPQARHGRKSNSRTFNGFKLHVLGDAVSGLVASLSVTPGNVHDGQPACRLVKRARRLVETIDEVLGDEAYGSVHRVVRIRRQTGVDVLAPVHDGSSPQGEKFSKNDFAFDSDEPSATCPAGVKTTDIKWIQGGRPRKSPRAMWPKSECQECPLAEKCPTSTSGRGRVVFHSREEELRARRQAWETEEVRQRYRRRGEGERLINQMTRHGARKARAWGLRNAELQAYLIAIRNNLAILAQQLAERSPTELQRGAVAA